MTDTPEEKYESIQQTIWGDEDTYEVDGYVDTGKLTQTEAELIQELCDAFDGEKLDRPEHTNKKQSFEPDKQKDKSYSTLWGWMYRLSRMGRDLKNADFTVDTLTEAAPTNLNDLMERGYYKADISAFLAGYGSGKTIFGARWLITQTLEYDGSRSLGMRIDFTKARDIA